MTEARPGVENIVIGAGLGRSRPRRPSRVRLSSGVLRVTLSPRWGRRDGDATEPLIVRDAAGWRAWLDENEGSSDGGGPLLAKIGDGRAHHSELCRGTRRSAVQRLDRRAEGRGRRSQLPAALHSAPPGVVVVGPQRAPRGATA